MTYYALPDGVKVRRGGDVELNGRLIGHVSRTACVRHYKTAPDRHYPCFKAESVHDMPYIIRMRRRSGVEWLVNIDEGFGSMVVA